MDFFGPVIFNCEEAFSIHTKPFLPVNLFTGTFFFLCSLILTVCAHLQGVTCFISLEDKRRKKTIMNYVSILKFNKKMFYIYAAIKCEHCLNGLYQTLQEYAESWNWNLHKFMELPQHRLQFSGYNFLYFPLNMISQKRLNSSIIHNCFQHFSIKTQTLEKQPINEAYPSLSTHPIMHTASRHFLRDLQLLREPILSACSEGQTSLVQWSLPSTLGWQCVNHLTRWYYSEAECHPSQAHAHNPKWHVPVS